MPRIALAALVVFGWLLLAGLASAPLTNGAGELRAREVLPERIALVAFRALVVGCPQLLSQAPLAQLARPLVAEQWLALLV